MPMPHPVQTIAITGAGRYYVQVAPGGSVSMQIQAATGLTFTLEGTNDRLKFSNVPYAVDGATAALGDAFTPTDPAAAPYQLLDVVLGNLADLCINVSAGTGTISARAGDGLKLLS